MADPTTAISTCQLDQALHLLRAISDHKSNDFSGVGVVFYDDIAALPHLQLTNETEDPCTVKLTDWNLATTLASISSMRSPLHDGFHFVETRSWRLSHISQFISPPIPADAAQRFRGRGARLMAAVLASLLPGITGVGLVSHSGEIYLFCGGVDLAKEN